MTYFVRLGYFCGANWSRWVPASNRAVNRDLCWTYRCETAEAAASTILRFGPCHPTTPKVHQGAKMLFGGASCRRVDWTSGDVVVAVARELSGSKTTEIALLQANTEIRFADTIQVVLIDLDSKVTVDGLASQIELLGVGLTLT